MSETKNRLGYDVHTALDISDVRQAADDAYTIVALKAILAERERELLELKGPCINAACALHCAHAGPCDVVH